MGTIDIACHWLHLHTSLLQGATSHKFVDPTGNYWMRLYYTDRKVLFSMCAGNELFYASLYLAHFTSGPLYLFYIMAVITFPVAVAKSGIALLQGYLAAVNIVGVDTKEREALKFGAMLDMLTDRCATMCLLTTLSTFYPSFMFLFRLSMTIDISCHWLHLHTSLLQGATSHKFVDPTGNYWMRLYY